jgi:hypothetical protein
VWVWVQVLVNNVDTVGVLAHLCGGASAGQHIIAQQKLYCHQDIYTLKKT